MPLSPPINIGSPYDRSSLRGKTVVVTGAANGLGALFVRHWAGLGAHVVIGDIDDAAGEALVARLRTELGDGGVVAHYQHCDVRSWDDQVALFDAARRVSPHGAIDVVVPGAGVVLGSASLRFERPPGPGPDGSFPRPDLGALEINVLGVAYTTHLALHHMSAGCLLLMGSVAGLVPFPGQSLYAMSKHGVCGLFRALRATTATGPGAIRVNMLCPYFVGGSAMLGPLAEAGFVAGGAGPATADAVVDAATRLVADQSIAGRALVVGPRVAAAAAVALGNGNDDDEKDNDDDSASAEAAVGIWECFAEDQEQLELFSRRWIALLRAVEQVKGWTGWAADVWRIVTGLVWRRQRTGQK